MSSKCTLGSSIKKPYINILFILITMSVIAMYTNFSTSNNVEFMLSKAQQWHRDFVRKNDDYNFPNTTISTVAEPKINFADIFNGKQSGKYLVLPISDPTKPKDVPVLADVFAGIGNQLFEFACSYAIAKKRNSDVYLTVPNKNTFSPSHKHTSGSRSFVLDHFNIWFKYLSNETMAKYGKIFGFQEKNIWENNLPKGKVLKVNDVCFSEYYFKDYREDIQDMFQLKIDERPVQEYLDLVENSESVSVHVRRGDYGRSKRTMPISYHKRAIKWMRRMVTNATFIVISDDMAYVKKELGAMENVVFFDNSKKFLSSLYDFLLMSRCKHNIIANSTFSWWAAYLNRNRDKIVIAPMPRHSPGWDEQAYKNKDKLKYRTLILTHFLYPTDWLTINPYEYVNATSR